MPAIHARQNSRVFSDSYGHERALRRAAAPATMLLMADSNIRRGNACTCSTERFGCLFGETRKWRDTEPSPDYAPRRPVACLRESVHGATIARSRGIPKGHPMRSLQPMALTLLLLAQAAGAEPIFDSHLHFSGAAASHFGPADIIERLDHNEVIGGVVSSWPNDGTLALYAAAPARFVPFLSIYREAADKSTWPHDERIIGEVEKALEAGPYRGIGELHIFAPDRRAPVYTRLLEIAAERDLVLQIHGDPAVIDAAFEHRPGLRIQWAHAGAYPYPDLLRDYLERYPNLHVDLSMRNERIAPDGELSMAWRELFFDYPDRFMVGMDTFSVRRWERFDELVNETRHWLDQLPADVARMIARENAERLFAPQGEE